MKTKIRAIARELALDTLGVIAKPSKGIHLMNSHFLTKEEELSSDYFDYQLGKLSKHSTIVPYSEAVELIEKKKQVKHSLIAFSYDDGYAECYSHIAPVLEKYNGQGCFFINPNFADGDEAYIKDFLKNNVHAPAYKRPMRWDEIRDLNRRGHIIGAHTMDHVRASDIITDEEKHHQIGLCKKVIEEQLNTACEHFAFTYGRMDKDFHQKDVDVARVYYKYIYSATDTKTYYSYDGVVLNRRHCEPYWKPSHVNHFISKEIRY